MKASDYLKEFERKQNDGPGKDHTLQENAMERAKHPTELHAGTAFDWQDVEAYEAELKRMEKEGGKLYPSRKERAEHDDENRAAPNDSEN